MGRHRDLEAACAATVRTESRCIPNEALRDRYERSYQAYRALTLAVYRPEGNAR
jgi:hypothetical protein